MGRLDNLKPFNTLTAEQRHEIAVKGGKARAAQRRAQREEIERRKIDKIAELEAKDELIHNLCQLVNMVYRTAKEKKLI